MIGWRTQRDGTLEGFPCNKVAFRSFFFGIASFASRSIRRRIRRGCAATLASNAGAAKVTSAETTVASVTTCLWSGTTDHIYLVVTALNSSAPLTAMKAEMVASITETISGLGDVGGFVTKTATDVTVVFIKGSTQVSLIVSTTAANADAVAAAAKKIAAGL